MKGLSFSLIESAFLKEDAGQYYLHCMVPLRVLRLNKSLFTLLQYIDNDGDLSDYLKRTPGIDAAKVTRSLLYLVSRGYLELESPAEIEEQPTVSIIIPVKDQPDDIVKCVRALKDLNYPRNKFEVIVVDDGSENSVADTFSPQDVRVIRQERSLGPAASRNNGAAQARGRVFAFLDADCVAGESWLTELIPFFGADGVGAVGGYVEGYYQGKSLDRYEAVSSSLNMGKRLLLEGNSDSALYVPTANMLVTRTAFEKTGGFNEALFLGEDVDFCWRLRKLGYNLIYAPYGVIAHKHRNDLWPMLKRRFDYGTSEAFLYRTHRDKKKTFLVSLLAALSLLALVLSIVLLSPWPLIGIPVFFGIDLVRRSNMLDKLEMAYPLRELGLATFRNYLSFYYFAFFHLVRYYLIVFIGFGFLWHPLWILGALMLVYASVADYFVKKPHMKFHLFLFFYLLEHLFYQAGVFWGCLKQKYFRCYLLKFSRP
jgi:mycofactocin system glycosyltransferase